jgi:lysine 6-dehydrogenase
MDKREILIVGAGMMGRVAAYFFLNHPQGPFAVRLAEKDPDILVEAASFLNSKNLEPIVADAEKDDLVDLLAGIRVCLSCVPYFLNPRLAKACLDSGVSFVDLGGNPVVTDKILAMDHECKDKHVSFIPDTGLAPGLAGILGYELASRFKECDEVHLRVGGLPQEPLGPLRYALFFSVHGLLNEYLEDAREIKKGEIISVPGLANIEPIAFEGIGTLEAFVTSGGTSTLPQTLLGKVKRLDYKTIRYPGHVSALKTLRSLWMTSTKPYRFNGVEVSPRQMLARVLDDNLPKNAPDMILLRVWATGDGKREEKIDLVLKMDEAKGLSAMGMLTAYPAAAIALAILKGRVPAGAHAQELVISYAWMKEQLGLFGIKI